MKLIIVLLFIECMLPIIIQAIQSSIPTDANTASTDSRYLLHTKLNALLQHSYQTLPMFVAAILLSLYLLVPLELVNRLVVGYVVFNVVFILANLASLTTLMRISWTIMVACNIMIFGLVWYFL